MILGIIGSRSYTDYNKFKSLIGKIGGISLILTGEAKGVDSMAARYALENGIPTRVYSADWKRYGKRSSSKRDEKIVKESDEIIAFFDNKSISTINCLNLARKYKKETTVHYI